MSWNARPGLPQRVSVARSAPTMPASATAPKNSLPWAPGKRSRSSTSAPAPSTSSVGRRGPSRTGGATRSIIAGAAKPVRSVGGPRQGATRLRSACRYSFHRGPQARRDRGWTERDALDVRLRLHLSDERHDRRLGLAGERRRVDADPDDQDHDGHEQGPLAGREVTKTAVRLMGDRPEDDPLVQPEQVDRREDDPGGCERGEPRVRLERPDQDEELADETVQPRQPQRREHDDQEQRREGGYHVPEAAEVRDH